MLSKQLFHIFFFYRSKIKISPEMIAAIGIQSNNALNRKNIRVFGNVSSHYNIVKHFT